MTSNENYLQKMLREANRHQELQLPLARIKKIMKLDDDVKKMVSFCCNFVHNAEKFYHSVTSFPAFILCSSRILLLLEFSHFR